MRGVDHFLPHWTEFFSNPVPLGHKLRESFLECPQISRIPWLAQSPSLSPLSLCAQFSLVGRVTAATQQVTSSSQPGGLSRGSTCLMKHTP